MFGMQTTIRLSFQFLQTLSPQTTIPDSDSTVVKRLQPTSHSLTPFLRMELLKFCEECSFWELEKLQLNTTETKKKEKIDTRQDQKIETN